jgi:hypothetical protein
MAVETETVPAVAPADEEQGKPASEHSVEKSIKYPTSVSFSSQLIKLQKPFYFFNKIKILTFSQAKLAVILTSIYISVFLIALDRTMYVVVVVIIACAVTYHNPQQYWHI